MPPQVVHPEVGTPPVLAAAARDLAVALDGRAGPLARGSIVGR